MQKLYKPLRHAIVVLVYNVLTFRVNHLDIIGKLSFAMSHNNYILTLL